MPAEWKETEGPTGYLLGKNVDQRKPPPRLVWGTGESFFRYDEQVLRFIEESLDLSLLEDWHLQRAAYRRLIQWFFAKRPGPAWISTIPYKPGSDSVLSKLSTCCDDRRFAGRFERRDQIRGLDVQCSPDQDGRLRNASVDFGLDLIRPVLPLKGFLFAYGTGNKVDKGVRLYRQSRSSRLLARGSIERGEKVLVFLGTADDEPLIAQNAAITVWRDFFDKTESLYRCPPCAVFKPASSTRLTGICARLHYPVDCRSASGRRKDLPSHQGQTPSDDVFAATRS